MRLEPVTGGEAVTKERPPVDRTSIDRLAGITDSQGDSVFGELLDAFPGSVPGRLDAVEHAAVPHPSRPGPETVVTVSVGVAAAEGDIDAFLLAADAALYRAKSGGRNRMAVAGRWFAIPEMAASP